MQVVHQLGHFGVHINQALGEFVGVAGGVADALNPRNICHQFNQQGEVGDISGVPHHAAVGVDVLSEQGDFFHTLRGQASHFFHHIVQGTAEFFAACVRHHAIAAIFAATFHDAHERAGAFHARLGQVVELFNFRKTDVDLRTLERYALVEQFGQTMQSLRAKHHVDIRRAGNDGVAFLASHATADGDLHALGLEMPDAT